MPGPRTSADILASGGTRWQLRQHRWRPVLRGVRIWHEEALDRLALVQAARLVLPAGGAIGARTAAWLHGVEVAAPDAPVDLVLPRDTPFAPRAGLRIRRALLAASDVVGVAGIPVTSPVRTAFDLARLEPLVEAVACLDALLHAGVVETAQVGAYAGERPGWRGVRRCAEALAYADGAAESPMESRLRLTLVLGGLPRPVVNQALYDQAGCFLARPDLRFGSVLVEFDGSVHREREQFVHDLRRQNRLVRAGFVVLRYTAGDVYRRPAEVVAEVGAAIATTSRRS